MKKVFFSLKGLLLMAIVEICGIGQYMDHQVITSLAVLIFASLCFLFTLLFVFVPYVKYDAENVDISYTVRGRRHHKWSDVKHVYSLNQIAYVTLITMNDKSRIILASFMTRDYLRKLKEILEYVGPSKVDDTTREIIKLNHINL